MEDEKQTILIIQHNAKASDLISFGLNRAGFCTFRAYDGESGLRMVQSQPPDVILLDLPGPMEPDTFDVCERLEENGSLIPVIVCIYEDETDLAAALNLNYIVKPFGMRELQEKIQTALLRSNLSAVPRFKTIGRFTIDTRRGTISKDGVLIPMNSQQEYTLFTFMASQPGTVFTREELLTQVWGYEHYLGNVRGVDIAIRRLRQKVEDNPAKPQFILTKRGGGYLFST